MTEQQRPKMVRVTVYIPEHDHKQLRSKLALDGISVSEWVRRKILNKIK